jgi:glycosyltransferase involved in cell wall biosynthesis
MHIVLNAHLISDQRGYRNAGVSIYSRRLLAALGELVQQGETDHRFTALAHAADLDAPGVAVSPGSVQLDRPLARIAWEQGVLPFTLTRLHGDLVHGLVNVLPLATRVPGVVTVHDLSFVRFPQLFPPFKRFYLTALCRASVRRARRVLAVSHQTAEDVTRFFGVDPQRIVIAPNGVAARFTPGTGPDAAFRAEQGLPARYWLFVGTLEPRKNLPMLLEAFARWRQTAAPAHQAVQLIIAGGKGWAYDDIFAQATRLGLHESVRFPGFIPDASLPDWYRGAELFLYPSTFEGFGLPVAEAMACGTPVLCSDAPGVREVAGDAAWRLPPDDVDAWVAALGRLATDPARRAALSAAGIAQAAQYTWRATALATLDAYAQAAAR